MTYHHSEKCAAAICAGDLNKNYKKEVIWYAREKVCARKPYLKFQKKQLEINKEVREGTFRNMDMGYTANDLENSSL